MRRVEKRAYFRISDMLQVEATKLPPMEVYPASRVIPYPLWQPMEGVPEGDLDLPLFRLLQSIHQKLDLILAHLTLEKIGFARVPYREVNLSAGGIRFCVDQPFEVGDVAEIHLVLPAVSPVYLVCYGRVNRWEAKGEAREVAFTFFNMDQGITSVLERYILQRQRQAINSL